MTQYWAAIHTHPQAEPDVRKGVEDLGFGACVPSYARLFYVGAKLHERRKALLPGYVFVALNDGDHGAWRDVESVKGVNHVLTAADKPVRIPGEQVAKIMLECVQGLYNVIQPRSANGQFAVAEPKPEQKRRRPRPRACKSTRARRRQAKRARHRIRTDMLNLAAA